MNLSDVLKTCGEGDRFRRSGKDMPILVIESGGFFRWHECPDLQDEYKLSVGDVIATDWEVERKTWDSGKKKVGRK